MSEPYPEPGVPGPEPGVEALVSTTGGLPVILPLGKRVAAPHPGAPPGLPGVDAHIPREELTYDFLRNVVRHQRWHVRVRGSARKLRKERRVSCVAKLGEGAYQPLLRAGLSPSCSSCSSWQS